MRYSSLLAAPALALAVAASAVHAGAQITMESGSRPTGPVRGTAGIGLTFAQPLGAFRDYVDFGGGFDGHLVWNLTRDGAWGVRLDGGYIIYGSETARKRLSNSIGDRIQVDVNTTNNIGMLGVGPQLVVPHGTIRPYLNGVAGVSYFFTQSSVEGTSNNVEFARTTNFSDAAFAYGGGGGLLFPLHVKSAPVSIDLGARYLHNGRTKYLREGSITDNPDGSISYTPIRSEVELMLYQLGVTIGLR